MRDSSLQSLKGSPLAIPSGPSLLTGHGRNGVGWLRSMHAWGLCPAAIRAPRPPAWLVRLERAAVAASVVA